MVVVQIGNGLKGHKKRGLRDNRISSRDHWEVRSEDSEGKLQVQLLCSCTGLRNRVRGVLSLLASPAAEDGVLAGESRRRDATPQRELSRPPLPVLFVACDVCGTRREWAV